MKTGFNPIRIQALCLAPSRELARQIMSVVVAMGKFTPVQTEYAIKDHLPKSTTRINAHIIVGTPGTMTDLIRRKVIDVSGVKVFVLDEADDIHIAALFGRGLQQYRDNFVFVTDSCCFNRISRSMDKSCWSRSQAPL